jgi:hypothetical protein
MFVRMSFQCFFSIAVAVAAAQDSLRTLSGRDMVLSPDRRASTGSGLGVWYGYLDDSAGSLRSVEPSSVFETGDCIVLHVVPNLAGYLYAIAEGPGGTWSFLARAGEASERPLSVTAMQRVRVPATSCIEFTPPAGTERVFIILLPDAAAVQEVIRSFRLSTASRAVSGGAPVDVLRLRLASRELRVRRQDQTAGDGEANAFGVYAEALPPRLFIEIKLQHRPTRAVTANTADHGGVPE